MNRQLNHNLKSNNRNNYISRTKITAIISIILLITVVSILSETSYASISGTINQSSIFTNPFSNISEINNANSFNNNFELIPDTTRLKGGVKKFHFYEKENGERIHYKAKLKDGILTSLYIDGEKVPDNELSKYESRIQKKLYEHETVTREYKKSKEEYKKFAEEYSGKMKDLRERLRDLRSDRFDFDFDFDFDRHVEIDIQKPDLSELRESMRELRRELKDSFADRSIIIPPIHIPEIHIPPIHVPPVPPVHFNDEDWDKWADEFKENMKDFKEKMKENRWHMEEFKENMNEFRGKMKELGAEMKKFGNFVKDIKNELIDDGIISSGDDIDELLLSENKMEVNGKSVSSDLHKKYKDMYEKHTGKKIEGNNKIRINN